MPYKLEENAASCNATTAAGEELPTSPTLGMRVDAESEGERMDNYMCSDAKVAGLEPEWRLS